MTCRRARPETRPAAAAPRLSLSGLTRRPCFERVSLTLRPGEIVGLFGLVGSGRSELLETIVGLHRADEGVLELDGRAASLPSPRDAARAGLVLVPEDRQRQGLLFNLAIVDNLVLPSAVTEGTVMVRRDRERRSGEGLVAEWRIKASGLAATPDTLSGGNQQKVVLARWLATRPRVLLLDEPTKGVDVGAKYEIHGIVRRVATEGTACLVVSSDLPEVLALADRILVMREGRIQGEIAGAEATEESVMRLATHEEGRGRVSWLWRVREARTVIILLAEIAVLHLVPLAGGRPQPPVPERRECAAHPQVLVDLRHRRRRRGHRDHLGRRGPLSGRGDRAGRGGGGPAVRGGRVRAHGQPGRRPLRSGVVAGAVTAALVVLVGLPPFIATLGMMGIARGAAFVITEGRFFDVSGALPPGWQPMGIPLAWIAPAVMIALGVVFQVLMNGFQWGRAVYAVGGNETAALYSGIAVGRVKTSVYLLAGTLAAVAGCVLVVVQGQGKADLATGYELDIIASAVVGGASLSGGRGSVLGAVLGTLIFGVLRNALPQIPGATFYDRLIVGLVVIVIVVMDQVMARQGK